MKLINIVITDEDILDLAEEFDVDPTVAMDRAQNWAKHVEATASQLIANQLTGVIENDQP